MATGRVFSGTRPAPPLMGRGLNLINGFGTGMRFFLKPGAGLGITPSRHAPPRLHIKFPMVYHQYDLFHSSTIHLLSEQPIIKLQEKKNLKLNIKITD